jgi:Na+/H+ antiporter NhaD/arsenite permease-like protein
MPSYKSAVLTLSLLSYMGIIGHTRKKTWYAGGGAALLIAAYALLHARSSAEVLGFTLGAVNWNVLGIFLGTLLIAEAFVESGVPALIAHALVGRAHTVGAAVLYVCVLTSLLSAFIENVATVLIMAPIALAVADRQRVSPVPFLIGLAVSANLQGTATLIGDPPSMILAGYMGLNFNQFFALAGKPGIFFAVQVGALISFGVLGLFFRRYKEPVVSGEKPRVSSVVPTVIVLLMILLLAFASVIDPEFTLVGGIICMVLGAAAAAWLVLAARMGFREIHAKMDFDTLLFLASVFILVESLAEAGVMEDMASFIIRVTGNDLFLVYTVVVWFSVLVSAFIDNVPYITAMIPVVRIISADLSVEPYLLVFGLLIGSCLGGNVTHVGASANVVAVSILKKRGYHIGVREFGRVGLPFTLAATFGSYLFVWFMWR